MTVVTGASGATSVEAHEVAIQRMAAAGVNLMTWLAVASEWQLDWARSETALALSDVVLQHAAGSGIVYLWLNRQGRVARAEGPKLNGER